MRSKLIRGAQWFAVVIPSLLVSSSVYAQATGTTTGVPTTPGIPNTGAGVAMVGLNTLFLVLATALVIGGFSYLFLATNNTDVEQL